MEQQEIKERIYQFLTKLKKADGLEYDTELFKSKYITSLFALQIVMFLEKEFGIQARCGLHCAPLAHKTLGTFPQGTVRFSVNPLTRFEDIDYLQAAVCEVMGI